MLAEHFTTANQILDNKTSGPNGVLAYMWAHGIDESGLPYFNNSTNEQPEIYYAVTETNRMGVPVVAPPAGTQDVYATKDDQTITVQLSKAKKLLEILDELEIDHPTTQDTDEIEVFVLAALLEEGYELRIETPFEAATHETYEEHGAELDKLSMTGAPTPYSFELSAKRALRRAEDSNGSALFSLEACQSIEDIRAQADLLSHINKVKQQIFAVEVDSFAGTVPVSNDKIESKVKGREGTPFYERGRFMTIEQIEDLLVGSLELAKNEDAADNRDAAYEIIATYDRIQAMKTIENDITNTPVLPITRKPKP